MLLSRLRPVLLTNIPSSTHSVNQSVWPCRSTSALSLCCFCFFSSTKMNMHMNASDLCESEHGALVWLRLPLNVKTLPLLLDLLLVTTPLYVLSVCFLPLPLPLHFPALTPPVSAVCSARRVGQPRSLQRWKHP